MSNAYASKYPSIVVDKSANSVNESLKKVMTVEEYYDLKHHTHSISSLSVEEGSMSYDEMQVKVIELTNTINTLNDIVQQQTETIQEYNNTIEQQNNTIQEQNNIVQRLEADTTELKQLINSQNEAIASIKEEISNMASVSDWDVETPGNQDAEGNTLGELMGFTMTEITD